MITNQHRSDIRRLFAKVKRDIEPVMAGCHPDADSVSLDMIVAQNTLRICMEVVLGECTPYDKQFCAELAVRMAAYAVSAAPVEDHDGLVAQVQHALPAALAHKRSVGAVILSTWNDYGVDRPNIPAKGSMQ